MSQSAKSKSTTVASAVVFAPQLRLAWWYGALRLLPVLALFYYLGIGPVVLPAAGLLLLGWTYWLWANNHRLVWQDGRLSAHRPFRWPWTASTRVAAVEVAALQRVAIRLGRGLDQRQWLDLTLHSGAPLRWRCDALHEQDAPEADDHDHPHDLPEHELFALLEDEDFYEGSLQHLATLLHQQGVSIEFLRGS